MQSKSVDFHKKFYGKSAKWINYCKKLYGIFQLHITNLKLPTICEVVVVPKIYKGKQFV